VAQAVISSTLELIPQPTYGDHYKIDRDPLWLHRPTQGAINTFAWYQCDQLSTPIELTAEDRQIAWTASYKAWGLAKEKRREQAQIFLHQAQRNYNYRLVVSATKQK